MASFNALYQPWIGAMDVQGQRQVYSIYDVLTKAHQLKKLTDPSPLVEYGMYRLLIAFIMDAFRPRTREDLIDLLDQETISVQALQIYITECEQDGSCFDLFDKEKPFMQSKYEEKWDKGLKPVALLVHDLPTGNNHVHFLHKQETEHALCPEDCLRALCAVNVFCTSGLQGPSSINGAPPYYVLASGENLFETLICNCMTQKEMKNIPYADPPIAWRGGIEIEPDKKIVDVSVLYGLTFSSRRITLIPGDTPVACSQCGKTNDSVVRNMYFQKGLDFQGYTSWRDGHVIINQKSGSSIKPNLAKDAWRNVTAIYAGDSKCRPIVVQQYKEVFDSRQNIPIMVFGLVTNQASYETWMREELSVDRRISQDDEKAKQITDALELADNVASELRKQVRNMLATEEQLSQCLQKYYQATRQVFFARLCPDIAQVDDSNYTKPLLRWKSDLLRITYSEFEACADRLGMQAKFLKARADASGKLSTKLNKLLKKGEENNG